MRLLHIGRATTNEIVVADQTVSRQHAQLMIDDIGQVTLVDLNSSNGCFVNGRRITGPTRLDSSDIVKVGEFLLPWRQYVQAGTQTQMGTSAAAPSPTPMSAAVQEIYAVPNDATQAPSPKKKTMLYVIVGAAALLVIILVVIWFTGGSTPTLEGKWKEKDDPKTWVNFEAGGKYTEGFKDAVVYDSANWKAMGVDRILIKKGEIETSKRYKFEGSNLLITYDGEMTEYVKDEK
jgi:pSer/pThr/pTyr-binding forkhead associated (FHA) protein